MADTSEHSPDAASAVCMQSGEAADVALLRRYRAAFMQSREAIVFVQQDSIIDYNPAALALLKIDSEVIMPRLGLPHFFPDRQPNGRNSRTLGSLYVKQAMRHGQALFEWQLQGLDGQDFPAEVMLSRIDIPGDTMLQATVRDISRQKRLERELSRTAMTDHLTGAFNRQRFDEEIRRALARRRRKAVTTALILLDIDHFKPVNDTWGHAVGDDVLVELTRQLNANLRIPDMLTRWGGEEFVMILPDTDRVEALQLAERLRELIAEHVFSVAGHITASLGVTTLQTDDSAYSCIERLDNALYQAKNLGRNKVIEAGQTAADPTGAAISPIGEPPTPL